MTQFKCGPGPQHVVDAPNVMVIARTLIRQALTIPASIPSIVPGRQTIISITVYSTSKKKRCAQQAEHLMLSSERLASDQGVSTVSAGNLSKSCSLSSPGACSMLQLHTIADIMRGVHRVRKLSSRSGIPQRADLYACSSNWLLATMEWVSLAGSESGHRNAKRENE